MSTYYQSWADVRVDDVVFIAWPDHALMDEADVPLVEFVVVEKSERSAVCVRDDGICRILITNLTAIKREP